MNDEHPTQPTDVLPEQDGTLTHNETGAANGIARVAGPGGAIDDAVNGTESALPHGAPISADYGASDEPTLSMPSAGAGDTPDLPVPAPGGIQAGTLDQDAAATLGQDAGAGGADASMPGQDQGAGDAVSAATPAEDTAATPVATAPDQDT